MSLNPNQSDREKRLAMKTGSIFLLVSFLIRAQLALETFIGFSEGGPRPRGFLLLQLLVIPIMEAFVAVGLWKGDKTIYRPLLLLVLYYLGNVLVRVMNGRITGALSPHLLDGIALVSLSIALGILLVGKANRVKRWISVGIFGLGYVSTFLLVQFLYAVGWF